MFYDVITDCLCLKIIFYDFRSQGNFSNFLSLPLKELRYSLCNLGIARAIKA